MFSSAREASRRRERAPTWGGSRKSISIEIRQCALDDCHCQQVLNPTPLNPTPATCHKRAAIFGMLRCRHCTATLAFLQCGSHLDQKLRCNKRKTALQHRKSCVARKWRFPAPLSCGFQAPTFKHPRFGPADIDLRCPNLRKLGSAPTPWSAVV